MTPKNATDLPTSPKRRKVLFCIPALTGGGAERVFSILLRHLDRSCLEIHLAVLNANGTFMRDIPEDIAVHDLDISQVRYALPGIIRLVRKLKPHTIVSTLVHMNLMLTLAKSFMPPGTRLLIREATTVSNLFRQTRFPRLWKWLYRHLYMRADAVICLSDAMVSDLAENFNLPPQKLIRIYNPVDIERIRELARGTSPFSGPGPHVIVVGRLSEEKGLDLLLDAMPLILRDFPSVRLAVLGEGPLLRVLREQSKKLGLAEVVHFLGFQENPWRYMKWADLFVLPSRFEGLPNALLEALTLGMRVVATDCSGAIREINEWDGRITLVPLGDTRALGDAVVSACKSRGVEAECPDVPSSRPGQFDLLRLVGEYSKLLLN